MEAGMGWPAGLDLERLRPARMSQRPTSFSSDIMSRSLCKPSGSKLSLILPCNTITPSYSRFKQTHPLMYFSADLSSACIRTRIVPFTFLQYFMLRVEADLGPCSSLWFENTGLHIFALRRLCSSSMYAAMQRLSAKLSLSGLRQACTGLKVD